MNLNPSRFIWSRLAGSWLGIGLLLSTQAAEKPAVYSSLTLHLSEGGLVQVKSLKGATLVGYQTQIPKHSKLSVESACFFHPLATPSGKVLTDVAPADHPHHRGVFLAWVEMQGDKRADFWGWGEHAPKKFRQVVHRGVRSIFWGGNKAQFALRNDWLAEDQRMLAEQLNASVRVRGTATILDLRYDLTPDSDITLARWAFGGFAVRGIKEGQVQAFNPQGPVNLPAPRHTQPESDWPDAPWYDFTFTAADGSVTGLAVLNHQRNPPTRWHNHPDLRLLNPCIVAPSEVIMLARKKFTLRYRVVAHDGPVPTELLNELSKSWKD